jgi:hypothetical protein
MIGAATPCQLSGGFHMKKISIATLALLAALNGAALAQAPASATSASQDPMVQMRSDKRAADTVYKNGLKAAKEERKAKVDAAVEAAVNEAKGKGADPLVAARTAKGKANKATKKEYDSKKKALAAERKAAYQAAEKNAKGK